MVRAAVGMSADSGESVSLSTQDVSLSAGGSLSAFAGERDLELEMGSHILRAWD